jgi:hypothetical protein
MSEDRGDVLRAYVDAAARLTEMPLTEEGVRAAAAAMVRIAEFASDVRGFVLADDVEIAGVFTP